MPANHPRHKGVLFIAAYKLFEGLLLAAAAFGVLRLLHQDVAAVVARWVNVVRIDPGNFFIHHLLSRLSLIDDHRLKELSVGTFLYAAIALTQGIGLALEKRWAEYFTIIVTASFVPLELLEIVHHATPLKLILFAINLLVVAYLIFELRRTASHRSAD